ncbi:MAG: HYR domain-containing protein [Pseudomonadota bacterium]
MTIYRRQIIIGILAIFLAQPLHAASTARISVDADGSQAIGNSYMTSMNSDGRYVTFESLATNLVTINTNDRSQIYVKDRTTGAVQIISVNTSGVAGNSNSWEPSISGDGHYVVFSSDASNLIANDGNQYRDVFLFDRNTNTLTRIAQTGVEPNGISHMPFVSRDGSYVVFSSLANNLLSNDTNNYRDVFIYRISSGAITRINLGPQGVQANNDSFSLGIGADAKYIVFVSSASNLVAGDNNAAYDIFLYDRLAGATELISVANNGTIGNNHSSWPSISNDGRIVAFLSLAGNLTPGDTNAKYDVFMRDRKFSTTTRISVDNAGNQANDFSWRPVVSGNGRFIAYWSNATNLVPNDTNAEGDVFVYDRIKNTVERVNVDTLGNAANATTDRMFGVSNDGLVISFNSFATNLVAGDSNRNSDVFVRLRDAPLNTVPIASAGAAQSLECVAGNASFQLDGSVSTDADEDALTFSWSGDFGTASGAWPSVTLPYGLHTTTLTVNDGNGGQAQATVDLRVTDTVAPSLTATNAAALEATSVNGASYQLIYQASDTCSAASVAATPTLSVYPLGVTNVSLSATDLAGNKATQNIKITVQDTQRPVISVPADIVAEATGIATLVNIGAASATDIFPVTIVNNAPSAYPLGDTLVTWTATDGNGNASPAQQRITLRDTTPPKLTIPADISIPATGMYTQVNIGQASATDAFTTTVTNDAPILGYGIGTTLVAWTATDNNGNSASAQQRVVVTDNAPPVLTIPANLSVEANAILSTVNLGAASAIDAVDGVVAVTNDAPLLFPLGTTTINWSASDKQGNRVTEQQIITVVDSTAPVLTLPLDLSVEATAVNTPASDINLGKATATDIFAVTLSNDAPATTYPLGATVVTWTAQDANKNSSRGRQLVTLRDTTAPTISAPPDIVAEATGPMTLVTLGNAIARDIFAVTVTHNAPAAGFAVGATPVTWTAADSSGNRATALQSVTIKDTTPPSLSIPADINVEATAILSLVNVGVASATDLVDGIVSVTHNAPSSFALGTTVITYTARDQHLNAVQATQRVTVVDTTAPVVRAPADIVVEATGTQTVVAIGNAYATDIFGVRSVSNAPASFALGTTLVTWTATDGNGNVSKATQKVTVVDTTAPTFKFDLLHATIYEHDHKMVHVASVSNLRDLVDNNPGVDINVTFTPTDTKHKKKHAELAWQVKKVGDTWKVYVRAEGEQKHHKERVYTIMLTISDSAGNTATDSKKVTVKHDRGHDQDHGRDAKN